MRSMTGFGKGIAENNERKITVEIKSVNHRQFDLSVKSPRSLFFCEDAVRRICKNYIVRGHIDVFVNYKDNRANKGEVNIDTGIVKQYVEAAKLLEELGLVNDLTVSQVLRLPDVVSYDESEDDDQDELTKLVCEATDTACKNLVVMREKEADNLKSELTGRLLNLKKLTAEIEERAPMVADIYAKKLKARMKDVLDGVEVDETRFLNEVAFFTDKSNIDEEITRLKSHIEHGLALMNEKGEVGKKLDFLVQEINREINTTGSKSNDIGLTEKVLSAKNELEKFREQVQNIE